MSLLYVMGSKFQLTTGFDATKVVSAISNLAPPVLTSTAHGLANSEEFLLLNNWPEFTKQLYRASSVGANAITLAGFDATNTEWYPTAGAVGTLQKVSNWLDMGQITAIQGGGGAPRNISTQILSERKPRVDPVGFEATTLNMTFAYDPSLADQVALQVSSRALGKRGFKFILPGNAGYMYAYGTVAFGPPSFDSNKAIERTLSVGMDSDFTYFV